MAVQNYQLKFLIKPLADNAGQVSSSLPGRRTGPGAHHQGAVWVGVGQAFLLLEAKGEVGGDKPRPGTSARHWPHPFSINVNWPLDLLVESDQMHAGVKGVCSPG